MQSQAANANMVGVNVVLNGAVTDAALNQLARYGKVRDVIAKIRAVTLQMSPGNLAAIRALSVVRAANVDAERGTGPTATAAAQDLADGISTWDLDAIQVTDKTPSGDVPTVSHDGSGVYVAVLDTGLANNWASNLPKDRIATQYARSFGGGGEVGNVSEQPNMWGQDQNSHGTHVMGTILGDDFGGTAVNGVAPRATVTPVKVLNQNGSCWSSVIARGITYVAKLKAYDPVLKNSPVVINMSLDAVEQAATDYAVSMGVIIVASAGNSGNAGMGYPGAYAPVISVAAGWNGEWTSRGWWHTDVPDPTDIGDFYITDFSSRQLPGQDLDVAAPGSWVPGPYQVNGQASYYDLGGTSMASPHVAGIVALMVQKNQALTADQAEAILEASSRPMNPGSLVVPQPSGATETFSWDGDATGSGLVSAATTLGSTP
ncbi:S8 family peptidase [Deinococcus yavapaiensis]|uniref:S8 family peptidase n=1 Tax=Deinococcus yavapaiensis TaxID=309889 RepID=UPI001B866FCE|nr:S8 family serine peptidase [Deinococcus yavapaiensis]